MPPPITAAIVFSKDALIAALALAAIACHLVLRFVFEVDGTMGGLRVADAPLVAALAMGGGPLVWDLLVKLRRREFGSDLLAGLSIVTSLALGQYLAGAIVVFMLSGGGALEAYAVRSASSALAALAKRMPSVAHRKKDGQVADIDLNAIALGDLLVVFPHEICPVDGAVSEGHGVMDESFLTGEPYRMSKAPGASVISGSINGDSVLTIRTDKLPVDSRYAKIMKVMRQSEENKPRMRRLGDQLGALYTPVAVAIALLAWLASGDSTRFLAVLVIATPCPLLIAIPVAIIGAVSLAARRSIIIRDPAALEKIDTCRTAIFDKTGTLTYGQPRLKDVVAGPDHDKNEVLRLVAALERYSKHPLAKAVLDAATKAGLSLPTPTGVSEAPGQGLTGTVAGRMIQITSRQKALESHPEMSAILPTTSGGLECIALIDGRYAGTLQFRDQPRADSASFIHHLGPKHRFERMLLVSGDRESEVRYLAEQVGITEVYAGQTPEEKVAIVRAETRRANTVFLGDGINDAPALTAATVGIAFGQNSDITTEAAGAVILDSSLQRVDEFLHISSRLRTIALQSAVGGMALSTIGMLAAAGGYLSPVAGALLQEGIDVLAVLNALRMAVPPRSLTDY
ncbi:MAG: heavy metal translocating P-type ATPase [Planctomycetota bacterium]